MPGIDHVYSVVANLDAASTLLRALGFTVSARGYHAGRGTANHLVVFANAYWELLGLGGDGPGLEVRKVVDERPGLAGCAIATEDIEAERQRLLARGIAVGAAHYLHRPVSGAGLGSEARFASASLGEDPRLAAHLFVCQHFTRDLVWSAGAESHANGAHALRELVVAGPDPSALQTWLRGIFAAPEAGPGLVTVMSSGDFAERFGHLPPALAKERAVLAALCLSGIRIWPDRDRLSRPLHVIERRDGWVLQSPLLGHSLLCLER